LKGGHWWAVVGGFWVMGLLLAFTPCVLPMLPILSSIIAGSGQATSRRGCWPWPIPWAWPCSTRPWAWLPAWRAKDWRRPADAVGGAQLRGLLLVLALAMFDVYELRLPHALSNQLDGMSRRLPGGSSSGCS
jgi:thiol:disulfide interchange protein DsbD